MGTYTQVHFRDEARAKVRAGATVLSGAVRVTLGPKSRSVLIEKMWGTPFVCAVSVASVLLLAEATMTEIEEKEKPAAHGAAAGELDWEMAKSRRSEAR